MLLINHSLFNIFICNHSNSHDFFTIIEAFGKIGRKVTPFGASDCLNFLTKQLFKLGDVTMIDRNSRDSSMNGMLELCRKILEGKCAIVFGESTWNLHPILPMQPIKIGVTNIAKITEKVIIPTIFEYVEVNDVCEKENELYKKCIVLFGHSISVTIEENIYKKTKEIQSIMESMRQRLWKQLEIIHFSHHNKCLYQIHIIIKRHIKRCNIRSHVMTRTCRKIIDKLTPLAYDINSVSFGGIEMPRAGLNKQIIVDAAIRLIEEKGYHALSMRELAKSLNVKAASLYNHIENMDEVIAKVGKYTISALNQTQFSAIEGLEKDSAIFALAIAYRQFAKDHPELYKVIMSLHRTDNAVIEKSARPITAPFMHVLNDYPLNEEQKMHWQRVLRSIIHGFLSQEEAGYFCHFPVNEESSYELGIQCYIDGLNAAVQNKAD